VTTKPLFSEPTAPHYDLRKKLWFSDPTALQPKFQGAPSKFRASSDFQMRRKLRVPEFQQLRVPKAPSWNNSSEFEKLIQVREAHPSSECSSKFEKLIRVQRLIRVLEANPSSKSSAGFEQFLRVRKVHPSSKPPSVLERLIRVRCDTEDSL
jgi:hypothetical protein